MQGATRHEPVQICKDICFNPRPLCRERPLTPALAFSFSSVSIHAPYAGSDSICLFSFCSILVSIHAPYAGSDPEVGYQTLHFREFQSTPPMQGATQRSDIKLCISESFNPRPLCRERLRFGFLYHPYGCFNPRPLCRERLISFQLLHSYNGFNPRPLCRERPGYWPYSIATINGFNPRPLCRERQKEYRFPLRRNMFQSTPPMQGATKFCRRYHQTSACFNPRPLCRERQRFTASLINNIVCFNPRPLCRERPIYL